MQFVAERAMWKNLDLAVKVGLNKVDYLGDNDKREMEIKIKLKLIFISLLFNWKSSNLRLFISDFSFAISC